MPKEEDHDRYPHDVSLQHGTQPRRDPISRQDTSRRPRVAVIEGGSFEGPKLKGTVLKGGSDWLISRPDGALQLDVRLTLKTDDGHLIGMIYRGYRYGPAAVIDRLNRGEKVEDRSITSVLHLSSRLRRKNTVGSTALSPLAMATACPPAQSMTSSRCCESGFVTKATVDGAVHPRAASGTSATLPAGLQMSAFGGFTDEPSIAPDSRVWPIAEVQAIDFSTGHKYNLWHGTL
jgi:hypothetical protein